MRDDEVICLILAKLMRWLRRFAPPLDGDSLGLLPGTDTTPSVFLATEVFYCAWCQHKVTPPSPPPERRSHLPWEGRIINAFKNDLKRFIEAGSSPAAEGGFKEVYSCQTEKQIHNYTINQLNHLCPFEPNEVSVRNPRIGSG